MTDNNHKYLSVLKNPNKGARKPTPPISASNVINLHPWEEIIGQCIEFFIENENLVFSLLINGQQIVATIPKHQNAAALKVGRSLVGHKIGILRTDGNAEKFIFRIVEKRGRLH